VIVATTTPPSESSPSSSSADLTEDSHGSERNGTEVGKGESEDGANETHDVNMLLASQMERGMASSEALAELLATNFLKVTKTRLQKERKNMQCNIFFLKLFLSPYTL